MDAKFPEAANGLLDFLKKSPTAFQAVETIGETLTAEGFTHLPESAEWSLVPGGKYFVTRNGTALLAFRIPETGGDHFLVAASHSDSPTFKLKPEFEMETARAYLRLNTEVYGGNLLYSWVDRPLSLAGRVIVEKDGVFTAKSVVIDRDLCIIPSVAIHMNRAANEGLKWNPACDTVPLLGSLAAKGAVKQLAAEAAGCAPEQIAGMDLYLYNRTPGTVWGPAQEYLSAPRIDDLMCAWGTLRGFLKTKAPKAVQVYAIFDNEETGSATKQGGGSFFLRDTLSRIAEAMGRDLRRMLAASFLVSADNGHARHPNHPELSDGQNAPLMNGGIVIKANAAQKYATEGLSSAIFEAICKKAEVPVQRFSNRSDLPGGSTLGSIADTLTPMPTVDIGLAQLAMHSAYETAGVKDALYLETASAAFFASALEAPADGILVLK